MYRYRDNFRFQWFFDTPNECAAILVICVMILAGLFLFFSQKTQEKNPSSKKWIIISLLSFSLCVFCEYWLVKTYSRGGYVAFVVGMLALALLTQQKKIGALVGSFFLFLLMIPAGIQRTIGIVANSADASVGHRLAVWKNVLAMSADYWQSGTGPSWSEFLEIHSAWYKPLWLEPTYNSAICDYLSLSAKGGIFTLFAYLAMIFTVLFFGYLFYRKKNNFLLAGLLCAQIAYLVSAIFSTFYEESFLFYSFFALQALTLFYVLFQLIKTKEFVILKKIYVPILSSGIVCCLLLLAGVYFRSQMPTKIEFQKKDLEIVMVTPNFIKPEGVILYLSESAKYPLKPSLREEARLTLRPLARKGFIVIAAKKMKGGFEGLEETKKLTSFVADYAKKNNLPWMLCGQGEGGRFAILCASSKTFAQNANLKGVVAIGSAASWPFPTLSPEKQMKNLKAPLLIIRGEKDSSTPFDQVDIFRNVTKQYNIPFQSLIIPDEYHYLGEKREDALKAIRDFFLKANKKNSL